MDNPLIYVTLAALLIKLVGSRILYLRWHRSQSACAIGLLLFFSVLQNVVEFTGYYFIHNMDSPLLGFFFRLYYVALTATLILIPLSMATLIFYKLKNYWFNISAFCFVVLSMALCFTDYLIAGFQAFKYAPSRVPGEYYNIYLAFGVLLLLLTLYILVFAQFFAKDQLNKGKLINLIIGFIPLVVVISALAVLMAFDFKITVAGIFPLMFSFFILVIALNYGVAKPTDLLMIVPFTKKFCLTLCVIGTTVKHFRHIDTSNVQSVTEEVNLAMVLLANEMFDQQKQAAKFIGMSEPRFSKLLKKAQISK